MYEKEQLFTLTIYCYADAIGSRGKYTAGKSEVLKRATRIGLDSDVGRIHTELVNRLVKEGWRPQPDKGQSWWQLRFRK